MEDTSEEMSERLDNGYSRSKWVAEQLVLAALRKGLPTTIYRLGKFVMTLSGTTLRPPRISASSTSGKRKGCRRDLSFKSTNASHPLCDNPDSYVGFARGGMGFAISILLSTGAYLVPFTIHGMFSPSFRSLDSYY